jgi:KaiC/GvpD/RAD55 family RecA-like ATPase
MKKIKSGIYGLNELLDGGINEHSVTVVIGTAGAGKTTLANQFIRRGLIDDQPCVFITLDENQDQIIKEAEEMGWANIRKYIDDDKLIFIDASGKQFTSFVKKDLPELVAQWEGINARIAIDPLTPVMWAIKDEYDRRELLLALMKETKKLGTVLCTLEEYGAAGDLSGRDTIIPMYIADCVIHLRYTSIGDSASFRKLKIIKCRYSRHAEEAYSYRILKGVGLIVLTEPKRAGREAQLKLSELTANIEAQKSLKDIPTEIYESILTGMRSYTGDELAGLPVDQLLRTIVAEYKKR